VGLFVLCPGIVLFKLVICHCCISLVTWSCSVLLTPVLLACAGFQCNLWQTRRLVLPGACCCYICEYRCKRVEWFSGGHVRFWSCGQGQLRPPCVRNRGCSCCLP